jgi:hypothetical protein
MIPRGYVVLRNTTSPTCAVTAVSENAWIIQKKK